MIYPGFSPGIFFAFPQRIKVRKRNANGTREVCQPRKEHGNVY